MDSEIPGVAYDVGTPLTTVATDVACLDACEADAACVSAMYVSATQTCYKKSTTLAASGAGSYTTTSGNDWYEKTPACNGNDYRGC